MGDVRVAGQRQVVSCCRCSWWWWCAASLLLPLFLGGGGGRRRFTAAFCCFLLLLSAAGLLLWHILHPYSLFSCCTPTNTHALSRMHICAAAAALRCNFSALSAALAPVCSVTPSWLHYFWVLLLTPTHYCSRAQHQFHNPAGGFVCIPESISTPKQTIIYNSQQRISWLPHR